MSERASVGFAYPTLLSFTALALLPIRCTASPSLSLCLPSYSYSPSSCSSALAPCSPRLVDCVTLTHPLTHSGSCCVPSATACARSLFPRLLMRSFGFRCRRRTQTEGCRVAQTHRRATGARGVGPQSLLPLSPSRLSLQLTRACASEADRSPSSPRLERQAACLPLLPHLTSCSSLCL